jgi:GxxExxY protein
VIAQLLKRHNLLAKTTMLYQNLTDKIIRAFYTVYNNLGYGFLEKVYERAMVLELFDLGMIAKAQHQIIVFYKEHEVGNYFADLIVDECIIIEVKVVETLHGEHKRQLLNYLKATTIEVGLLLNFGPKPQVARQIFTNDRK